MKFNVADAIDSLVRVLAFIAPLSKSKFDDWLLGMLKAIQSSPDFIAVIQKVIDQLFGAGVPEGALATVDVQGAIDAHNAEFATAFNDSPALQVWSSEQRPENVPEGAQAFGIGTVIAILSNLPTLIALLKALFEGKFGKVE